MSMACRGGPAHSVKILWRDMVVIPCMQIFGAFFRFITILALIDSTMEEIGIDICIPQESSPSLTQQGNQASPTQYTEELIAINMLSDTANPQGMERSTMQCVPHPELHLSDERETEPTGIAHFLPLMIV